MTDQEIARAVETMIREDAARPPPEQIRDLIEAGVIDEQGRVLLGSWNKTRQDQQALQQNGKSKASCPSKVERT